MHKEPLLSNVRVVEVGMGSVGPWTGLLLADMGAEVIKVESIARPDMTRGMGGPTLFTTKDGKPFFSDYPDGKPGRKFWNRNSRFNSYSVSKRDVTIELTNPKGLEIFKRLIKVSDVFLSNLAAGVAEKLGITYEELARVNPKIVYLSATGYGRTGPYTPRVAMGNAIDAACGYSGLRDYGDGDSSAISPCTLCDSVTTATNAFAIVSALYYRNRTGRGMFADVSMVEANMAYIGEAIMEYTMNNRVQRSSGNRDAARAPQGCYRCKGEDQWVTVSVASDEEWQKFARTIGKPQLAKDKKYAGLPARLAAQDELDKLISAWTAEHDKFEVMRLLQDSGIAASAVQDNAEVYSDPHLKQRGFWSVIDHPDAGRRIHPGRMWVLKRTPAAERKYAPCLGQDNDYVLGQVIGLTRQEMLDLEREGLIGTVPIGAESVTSYGNLDDD